MYNIIKLLSNSVFIKRISILEEKISKGLDNSEWSSNWRLRNGIRILIPWPRRMDAFGYQTSQDLNYDAPDDLAAYNESEIKHKRCYWPNNHVYYTKGLWRAEDCDEDLAVFFRSNSANKSHHYVVAMNFLSTASENGFEDFMLPEDMRCQFKSDYGVIHAEDVRRYLDAMSLDGPISPFNVMDYRIGRFLCHAAMMGDNHLAKQLDDDNQLFD